MTRIAILFVAAACSNEAAGEAPAAPTPTPAATPRKLVIDVPKGWTAGEDYIQFRTIHQTVEGEKLSIVYGPSPDWEDIPTDPAKYGAVAAKLLDTEVLLSEKRGRLHYYEIGTRGAFMYVLKGADGKLYECNGGTLAHYPKTKAAVAEAHAICQTMRDVPDQRRGNRAQ